MQNKDKKVGTMKMIKVRVRSPIKSQVLISFEKDHIVEGTSIVPLIYSTCTVSVTEPNLFFKMQILTLQVFFLNISSVFIYSLLPNVGGFSALKTSLTAFCIMYIALSLYPDSTVQFSLNVPEIVNDSTD